MWCLWSAIIESTVWCLLSVFSVESTVWCLLSAISVEFTVWCLRSAFSEESTVWCLLSAFSVESTVWCLLSAFSVESTVWCLLSAFWVESTVWYLLSAFSVESTVWCLLSVFSLESTVWCLRRQTGSVDSNGFWQLSFRFCVTTTFIGLTSHYDVAFCARHDDTRRQENDGKLRQDTIGDYDKVLRQYAGGLPLRGGYFGQFEWSLSELRNVNTKGLFTPSESGSENEKDERVIRTDLHAAEVERRRFWTLWYHWWLVEPPMWLTDGFSVTFLEGGGDCVHTRDSCTATIHSN